MRGALTDFAGEALACVEAINRAESLDALAYEVARGLDRFGFEHFVATLRPRAGQTIGDAILLSRLPDGWARVYEERSYLDHDPVFKLCQTASNAFTWSEAVRREARDFRSLSIMSEAGRYGMKDGICLPVHGAGSLEGCVSLSGRAPDLSPRVRPVVHFIAVHAYLRSRQMAPRERDTRLLTPREREVLTWAARGFSAARTAGMLGITERTVTAHIVSACDKLDAANKTAAVAQAIHRGHISL